MEVPRSIFEGVIVELWSGRLSRALRSDRDTPEVEVSQCLGDDYGFPVASSSIGKLNLAPRLEAPRLEGKE